MVDVVERRSGYHHNSYLRDELWKQYKHIRDVINKRKSPVSEKVVDDLRGLEQNPQKSLTRFPQQSVVPVAIGN